MAIAPLLYVPLILGLLFNLGALYIVSTKSRKDLSEYRKLLTLFLISDLLYTMFQGVLEPIVIVSGDLFLIFSPGPIQSNLVLSIYCGLISMSFVIISIHFVFRAIVMSSKSYHVSYLDWRKMAFICIIFLSISILLVCKYTLLIGFNYERKLREYFNSINSPFLRDPTNEIVVFRAHGNSGAMATNILLTTLFVVALVGSFVIAIIASSAYIIRQLSSNGRNSDAWRNHHRHLFVALMVQFLIPLILLYTSSTVFLLAPFLGNRSSTFSTPTWFLTTILSIYPIIDPLAIILLINDYRRAVMEMGRRLSKRFHSIHPLEGSNSCSG